MGKCVGGLSGAASCRGASWGPGTRARRPLVGCSGERKKSKEEVMHRTVVRSAVVLMIMAMIGIGTSRLSTSAQDATPSPAAPPLVGTWVVGIISASDND